MPIRSQVFIGRSKLVEHVDRFNATAPTTPMAYRSARCPTSGTTAPSTIGHDVADDQRHDRHAPAVQPAERARQLLVASHHVLNAHQVRDRRVDRRQQQQREDDRRDAPRTSGPT